MALYNNVLEAIGHTPLIKLSRLSSDEAAQIYGKCESFNPMHSVKDRIALAMIEDAERAGLLTHDKYVIEPTSGNTGIGLAMVCAAKGYQLKVTMPETMTEERRKLLKAFGAERILTPGAQGMGGAVARAEEIMRSDPRAYMANQFQNPSNPKIHMLTTAREIMNDLAQVDALVAGVGTGGTLTGVGEELKKRNPETKVVAVEPARSPVLSGGSPGPHRIQGIGAGFVPKVLNKGVIDQIIEVEDSQAIHYARELALKEGLLCGISSGAALCAAIQVAGDLGTGKNLVVILPDTGERYLSTDLFMSEAHVLEG